MKKYSYKVKDWSGKTIRGVVEANGLPEALESIRSSGFVPLRIWEYQKNPLSRLTNLSALTISKKQISNFTRQLATMMTAGLPLTDALSLLKNQAEGQSGFSEMVDDMLNKVRGGTSLAESLSKYEKHFGSAYVASIAAGEEGGVLESILEKMAHNMEVENEFKGKVKGAMIYPIIVVVGMILVVIIMMIFVIPQLASLYDDFGSEMPAITQVLMSISDFFRMFWFLVPLIPIGIIATFRMGASSPEFNLKKDQLILKIPIVGELVKKTTIANSGRTLSMLLTAGISLNEAMVIVSDVAGNEVFRSAYLKIKDRVEKGFSISESFGEHDQIFPPIVTQMVTTGEETGKLDEVLMRVADYFTVESEQSVKALTSAIEPLIIVFLGIGVAFLVVAIIMPIYNLTSQF